MKFTFKTPFYLLLALPLFFASCTKEGPAGPAGPQGPAGPTGAAGAAGAQGAQGEPGAANVIYSDWLDVTFSPQTDTTGGRLDTLGWSAEIPAPQLVDSILNKGVVKVYLNLGNSDSASAVVVALPFITSDGALINPFYFPGTIALDANIDASTYTDPSDSKKYLQYRYILIPGGTAAGRKPNVGIHWDNYAEVKKYLGLKD